MSIRPHLRYPAKVLAVAMLWLWCAFIAMLWGGGGFLAAASVIAGWFTPVVWSAVADE